MKIFIYKSLVICVLTFVMFHLTLGYTIKSYKNKFFNTFSKDKIVFLKDQARNEIKNSLKKENILYPEDAKLLRDFINKLIIEMNY
ncbi:hypothetical protein OAA82_01580 [Pelagibacteraceae bacterium]|nr:hypothetical protein [Pelagibacteraceae bacterium]